MVLRATCKIRLHDDPRQRLRAEGKPYIFAILHAHQVSAILGAEAGTGAMVSRSADGQIIVPALRLAKCVPYRGSSSRGGKSKGGLTALYGLAEHVQRGNPAYLAVDGPRGPRGAVHKGIAHLAKATGAIVLPIAPIPTRRWVLRKSWDRLQIPKPFSTVNGYFAPSLAIQPGEKLDDFCRRIESSLRSLEQQHDRQESSDG